MSNPAESGKSRTPKLQLKEYKILLPYISSYRLKYFFGILCLIIVDAAQIAIPQFLRIAVDLISGGVFELKQIVLLCLCMAGTMAIVALGRFLWRYFLGGAARTIEAQLRERLFDHLQKLSWDFYQKNKIGDLMARSINDLNMVRRALGMGLVAFFDFIFMATAILIIIFIQDARSAMFSIIPLPLITLLIMIFGGMIGKKFRAAHVAYSTLSDNAQETFAGISVVKSFAKEWWFIKKFASSNDDYRKANMELVRLFGFFFPFIHFLSGFTILVMLVIGGLRVIQGDMSPGSLVAMFRYLGMLIWPLMGAGFMVNMIQRGAVALGRINEILNTEPSITNNKEQVAESGEKRERESFSAVEISDLSFSYDEDKNALEGINLSVERGQWLGIMGRTGSGKSTLIKTFTRTVDPPPGSVRVFGLDVRDWPLQELRKLFAVSPQDSYLFSDSIANNIAYGLEKSEKRNVDDKEIIDKAINFASLNKDLSLFHDGKNTLIGERGLTLSGGQKQRVAIARAAIMESEFLILDDSFSAIDNETEQNILQALRKERANRTTIIISHRVSTLKHTDKVLVLDKGKLLEYGSPAELVESGGFYYRMAALQSIENQNALPSDSVDKTYEAGNG